MTTVVPPTASYAFSSMVVPDPDYLVVLKNGRFDDTSRAQMDGMFSRLAQTPDAPLVIHFHGGLVNKDSGVAIADRLATTYRDAGGFPAFIVWESGLGEVLSHNLPEILEEAAFQRLFGYVRDAVIRHVASTTGIEAAAAGDDSFDSTSSALRGLDELAVNPAEADAFARQIDGDLELRIFQDAVETDAFQATADLAADSASAASVDFSHPVRLRTSLHTLMSPDVVGEIRGARSAEATAASIGLTRLGLGAARVLTRVVIRFIRGRDHGLHATVVEELLREFYIANAAGLVWSAMRQDTDDAFRGPGNQFGGTALVENLVALSRRDPDRRIVLIGHSTGAVYICHLLRHLDAALGGPGMAPNATADVVMLAPACTAELFDLTLREYGHRVGQFRMFALDDATERSDHVIRSANPTIDSLTKYLYPSSLLYFVSGVCESETDTPLLGMQRFLNEDDPFSAAAFPALARIRQYLSTMSAGAVWSPATNAPAGWRSNAKDHGEFDDDPVTLASVQYCIRSLPDSSPRPRSSSASASAAASSDYSAPVSASLSRDSVLAHDDAPVRSSREPFTGRLIVQFDRTEYRRVAKSLRNATGVRFETANDAGAASASLEPGMGILLPDLGIGVFRNEGVDGMGRLSSAAAHTPIRRVCRERWVRAAGSAQPASPLPWAVAEPWDELQSAWHVCATGASTSSRTGRGIRIGILDSGLDEDHPHFSANRSRLTYESFLKPLPASDDFGHGSHCAGIAGGDRIPASDCGRYGIAPESELYIARVLDAGGHGPEAAVLQAIDGAIRAGCQIVSMSLVLGIADEDADALLADVLQEAVELNGMAFFAASGNDSLNPYRRKPVRRPASYGTVSSVGAVGRTGAVAIDSNGDLADPPVDFVSTGSDVLSAWNEDPHWRVCSGTSMATPVVAGLAALWAEASGERGNSLVNVVRANGRLSNGSIFPLAPE